ncbi:MAG: hypothetical protein M3261_00855, partial [Thermoproteota archaeon]|nr:hypothetical protein [Thermoproteota archaeon]
DVLILSLFLAATTSILTQNAFAARVALDSEKIDVRGRAITVTLPAPYGTITAYHLFIVYTDKHAQQFVCQGFPFDPATGQVPSDSVLSSDPAGLLTLGHCINFLPSNRDFIPDAPSITVASGKEAHKAYECFAEKTNLFNSAEVPYHVITGPNSNTYTRTMLDTCGIQAQKPSVTTITPGWDISIPL